MRPVRSGAPSLTEYTYTGQYSYTADFGLMFYNARWYDPALGRFAQADIVIPEGVQGYDRYAYTFNNPIIYTDPTGHEPRIIWLSGFNPSYIQKQPDGDTCAPTSIAMAMSIVLNQRVEESTITSAVESMNLKPKNHGMLPAQQEVAINLLDMGVTAEGSSWNSRGDLIDNVMNDVTCIVTVSWDDLSVYGHVLVVVGYDAYTGELLFMDPASNKVISETEFKDVYKTSFEDAWATWESNTLMGNPGIPGGSMIIIEKEKNVGIPSPSRSSGGGGRRGTGGVFWQ